MPHTRVSHPVQHFTALTAHKAPGSKFVSKDQYLRYFLLAYRTLYPDSGMSVEEQCKALEVRQFFVLLRGRVFMWVCCCRGSGRMTGAATRR